MLFETVRNEILFVEVSMFYLIGMDHEKPSCVNIKDKITSMFCIWNSEDVKTACRVWTASVGNKDYLKVHSIRTCLNKLQVYII